MIDSPQHSFSQDLESSPIDVELNEFLQLRKALEQDVVEAAKALLGCILVHDKVSAQIVEVEAYGGDYDPGSHAARGKTKRNWVMFEQPGLAYVYFNYGMHWLFNVSAQREGEPAAILVRAAEPLTGLETMYKRRPKAHKEEGLLSGPGKLAAAFGLTGEHTGHNLLDSNSSLCIVRKDFPKKILSGPRVGLGQGKGEHLLWRFIDAEKLRWSSQPRLQY